MKPTDHQKSRQELKKWLAVCRDRREKQMALKIFRKREGRVFHHRFELKLSPDLIEHLRRGLIEPGIGAPWVDDEEEKP